MSGLRKAFQAESHRAAPLGAARPRAKSKSPPSLDFSSSLKREDHSRHREDPPRPSLDDVTRARQSYAENKKRADEYLKETHMSDLKRRYAALRVKEREREESKKRYLEHLPVAPSNDEVHEMERKTLNIIHRPRASHSPTRTTHFNKKQCAGLLFPTRHAENVVVWADSDLTVARDACLVTRALAEGCHVPHVPDLDVVLKCLRDGLVIVRGNKDDLVHFETRGLEFDPSFRSAFWKDLVASLQIDEDKIESVNDGKGTKLIGCGTYNVVLQYETSYLPSWLPPCQAVRVTRHTKYQAFEAARDEIFNIMFADMNGFGVPVHGISAFSAPRGEGEINATYKRRGLRFGVVMSMPRAKSDLYDYMENGCTSAITTRQVAIDCIDLMYRISRAGVAFLDIKPRNILRIQHNSVTKLYISDCDSALFFIDNTRDWRALLLLNLGLLTSHVANLRMTSAARSAWVEMVQPALRQLVDRRRDYESDWLFAARCVEVDFGMLPADRKSDFELQRMLSVCCTQYFFKNTMEGAPSNQWHWKNKESNTQELNRFWKTYDGKNTDKYCRAWPPTWVGMDNVPLIKQLVDFSVGPVS